MELKRLKGQLATARRGHKLLKDKCDELMRRFLDAVREAKTLREALSERLDEVDGRFAVAAAEVDPRMITAALSLPASELSLVETERNVMSVIVPEYKIEYSAASKQSYGFAFTTGALDAASAAIGEVTPDLIRLAELEKTALLLCDEIERTRRRVNALEYIMIPQYEVTIKSISMKLDENERGNISRLMKVKDMMVKAAIEQQKARDRLS
jgi:V/A-type H+-transporting ATPase subunit D